MREVASQSRRSIVLGVLAALGWTIAKITIPLLALQAVDHGIDPYDRGALMRWSIAVVVATMFVGGCTAYRRSRSRYEPRPSCDAGSSTSCSGCTSATTTAPRSAS